MLEAHLNDILKTRKEVTLGFKGGIYYAFSGATQGEATSIKNAVERLVIKMTQEEEPEKLW